MPRQSGIGRLGRRPLFDGAAIEVGEIPIESVAASALGPSDRLRLPPNVWLRAPADRNQLRRYQGLELPPPPPVVDLFGFPLHLPPGLWSQTGAPH